MIDELFKRLAGIREPSVRLEDVERDPGLRGETVLRELADRARPSARVLPEEGPTPEEKEQVGRDLLNHIDKVTTPAVPYDEVAVLEAQLGRAQARAAQLRAEADLLELKARQSRDDAQAAAADDTPAGEEAPESAETVDARASVEAGSAQTGAAPDAATRLAQAQSQAERLRVKADALEAEARQAADLEAAQAGDAA